MCELPRRVHIYIHQCWDHHRSYSRRCGHKRERNTFGLPLSSCVDTDLYVSLPQKASHRPSRRSTKLNGLCSDDTFVRAKSGSSGYRNSLPVLVGTLASVAGGTNNAINQFVCFVSFEVCRTDHQPDRRVTSATLRSNHWLVFNICLSTTAHRKIWGEHRCTERDCSLLFRNLLAVVSCALTLDLAGLQTACAAETPKTFLTLLGSPTHFGVYGDSLLTRVR